MRILAITPYYDPEGGGLERYAHAILSRLASKGHDVRVLTFTRDSQPDGNVDGVLVERVVPRVRLGNTPLAGSFSGRVSRAIGEGNPDAVVAHTPVPFPAEMAYLAARKAGVPFIVTYHAGRLRGSHWALDGIAAIDRATLERRMLAGAHRLIAVSPYVRDHALADHAERVEIVPPGVDAQRFRPGGRPRGRSILFVAPLSRSYRWKGVDILWSAFERVHRRMPEARLTLVGDGDRRAEFAAKASGLAGAVTFAGRLSDDELVREYQDAAVTVLPSTTDAESFGMTLAEANACGRPVVASRIGGIPDFVREGVNGLLARPGDPVDLARRILEVLSDDDLARRLSVRGRELVVRDHDWARLASATEAVLEAAAANPRSANVGAELPRPATSL
ncbi:MAG: glycosyltransferase family 4 protein [Euryarchaeota archaeon]|nr:glycosyltransferase family 4 protein [Euryarchaeota archaeon]